MGSFLRPQMSTNFKISYTGWSFDSNLWCTLKVSLFKSTLLISLYFRRTPYLHYRSTLILHICQPKQVILFFVLLHLRTTFWVISYQSLQLLLLRLQGYIPIITVIFQVIISAEFITLCSRFHVLAPLLQNLACSMTTFLAGWVFRF